MRAAGYRFPNCVHPSKGFRASVCQRTGFAATTPAALSGTHGPSVCEIFHACRITPKPQKLTCGGRNLLKTTSSYRQPGLPSATPANLAYANTSFLSARVDCSHTARFAMHVTACLCSSTLPQSAFGSFPNRRGSAACFSLASLASPASASGGRCLICPSPTFDKNSFYLAYWITVLRGEPVGATGGRSNPGISIHSPVSSLLSP